MRVSRAPGRLDVMGGIADYTGASVCQLTLDRAAAVVLQERTDRQVRFFSFNLYDEHRPFTLQAPLDALARGPAEALRHDFTDSGRQWAAYLAGCLFVLHDRRFVDLSNPAVRGFNVALLGDLPLGAGIASSAAIEVAMMMNLRDHWGLTRPCAGRSLRIANESAINPVLLAELCQTVENRIVGSPCGVMDQVASCWGESGKLLRLKCQPHEILPSLAIPAGVRFVGINSGVKHAVGGGAYGRTRCAAFMAHRMILESMRRIGAAAGRRLLADPMGGYLANLDPDDYKRMFRPHLPEFMLGKAFLDEYAGTIDKATRVEPDVQYPVQHAADHHVLEARRVVRFARHLEEAAAANTPEQRGLALDKAGHLMYASHQSYSLDAMLGAPETDLLVKLVRDHERAGLYGAKITGGGSGGTVAILADISPKTDAALADILDQYTRQTGRQPQLFNGASPGAWHVGTALLTGKA